jgi:flagellin-like hook-associated protein FlgL
VLTELTNLAAALNANDTTAIADGAAALQRAFDRAVAAQGRVGNDLRSIEDVRTLLADAKLSALTRLSQIEDVDLAEASTRLVQSETAYRAALTAMATIGRLSLMDYLK